MKVYGADFSGARDPSRGIYFAEGLLDNKSLFIKRIVHCDDRLDLLSAIHFSKAPWGLDFPFSFPVEALRKMEISSWRELLARVVKYERSEFDRLISEHGIISCEVRCREPSISCRAADAYTNAFSPLKRNMPNMRMMTYAGLKLLSYVCRLGNVVYPFDQLNGKVSRLYEVYPSNTWHQAGLSRNTDLEPFIKNIYDKYGFQVKIENHKLRMVNLDAADAVVACVTLAYALERYGLEDDWNRQHAWISDLEWANRHEEGLIVQVD